MTNEATMLIITSDGDIIRQCLLADKNNNNKRTIDITEQNPTKKRKKSSINKVCVICGDKAIGYNYGAISCASCKAFFHRIGNEDLKKYKCLMNTENCVIDHKISRKCYRCRLKRCLTMGMKKEYLQSQEEIQRKQNIKTSYLKPMIPEEFLIIQNIQSAFLSVFDNDCTEYNELVSLRSQDLSDLIKCLQFNSAIALRLIKFYRSIDHFENLDCNDRFTLIKYNILVLLSILSRFRRKSLTQSPLSSQQHEQEIKQQIYMLCNRSDSMYEIIIDLTIHLNDIIQSDDILLCLILIIFLFSKGLSMHEYEPSLHDSLSVHQAQLYYTEILWNYLISKQNEVNTCKYFTKMITVMFRTQIEMLKYKDFLRTEMMTLNTVDEIAPLMPTILHIS